MPGGIRQVSQFFWSAFIAQNSDMGAEPTLRAATDPAAKNAQYYGPGGFGEQRGHPKLVKSSAQSHDEAHPAQAVDRVRGADRRDVPRLMRSVEEHSGSSPS